MTTLFGNTPDFLKQIMGALHEKYRHDQLFPKGLAESSMTSAVLFLLGLYAGQNRSSPEPCLILNKRSLKVKQPGDLCCPGGSISSPLDVFLAKLLYLPGSPLTRWPHWPYWHKRRHHSARRLALLFATCLRESFEEMRLNPLGVKFLGPLPSQEMVMFQRVIYPVVCWEYRQQRFYPNWEVESIVYIPLRNLLDFSNYARYRLDIGTPHKNSKNPAIKEYPCFLHVNQNGREVLWGATFRITMVFLELVFGFRLPGIESLPVVHGSLDKNYLTGNG